MTDKSSLWQEYECEQLFEQISTTHKKVKTQDCNDYGTYPVVDQGSKLIAGYIDDETKVIKIDLPVCIFGDHTRVVKWIDFDFVPGADGTKILSPKEFLHPRFFYYLLNSIEIESKGYARHFKQLKSASVKVPSKVMQVRLADKLDVVFAKLEMTQSRLDKVPQLLKRFRMSVLSAAVSGELTEEWRDANNPGDWSEIKVNNIVEKIEAGKNLKCHERPPREDELGIVKISAVTWGVYDEEESKTLPDSSLFLENRRINVGDFLISRANTLELLGMPVIVHQVTKNLMLSDKVWRIIAEDADKQWLSIFLRSPEGRKRIESRATGNQESMRNIAQKAFLDIDLPMPSPEEKEAIVSIVNGLFSKADLVEKQYLVAKQRVDKLMQSILARAFRGELFEPFSDKADRVAQPQSADVTDELSTVAEDTALEQLDKSPTQPQPTTKAVNDKSELLAQLKSAPKAMTAQQLFDSASVETFKAIDELFVELKRLLELNLVEKVGEGENCKFKAAK